MAMSQNHKNALSRGRTEAAAIKGYLESINSRRPGRPVTAGSQRARIKKLETAIANEQDPLRRVELTQKRMDLEDSLKALNHQDDAKALEQQFIRYASGYSERKGISYSAWREAGVPAATLSAAGIRRTRRGSPR